MRYALGVEYDGSDYLGWQNLGEGGPSVQATLEQALGSVADSPIQVVCAGRTDAGVHGECQVVHFDSDVQRDPRGWMLGTTTRLPRSVAVRWCVPVADDFTHGFSAQARRYRYRLLNRQVRPALYRQTLSWERRALDVALMHEAGQALLGENDFNAFRSIQCQALHARRNMHALQVSRHGDVVEVDVQANAFLHHMIRNIVGSLILVGSGERPVGWMGELLAGRDRTVAGPTAPPQGLVFLGPLYPDRWNLPAEVTPMNRSYYRTRIKFCGMTRAGDVRLAGELGVDAVGFIFARESKRRVAPAEARAMRQAIAPMVDVVALFRDNSREEVREVLRTVRPTLLQFHGEEDEAFCRSFNMPYLKAIAMGGRDDVNARALQLRYPSAAGFLFDSHAPGGSGGSGVAFEWDRIPTGLHRPFLLAGGLVPDNVFEAITATLPWGVDVSSGIEVSPGIKDGNLMRRFVEEARRADCAELD